MITNNPGTDDSGRNDSLAFENADLLEESGNEEESHSNEEPKNSGENSEKYDNQEQSEDLLLENSPFNIITNSGGASQRSTSMSINNLNDITFKPIICST